MRTLAFIDESDTGPMGFAMSFSDDREAAQVEKVGKEVAEIVRPMGYRSTWRINDGSGVGPINVVYLFENDKRVPVGWLELPIDLVTDDKFGAGNIVELFASKRINTLCQMTMIP